MCVQDAEQVFASLFLTFYVFFYIFLVDSQVPHAAWIYEEINHTNHVSDSDTDIYMNASSPTNPDKEISSTVQPPQDQNLTYTTVSFKKNPDDAAVTFSKEESATEYATVQHHSGLE